MAARHHPRASRPRARRWRGARARIGLIVLATDQTIEHEWRQIMGGLEGVAVYQSRIWNDARITPETLRQMEGRLADSAAVIMPGLPLAVVAFGCTSAAMVIGEEQVVRPAARGPAGGHGHHADHGRLRGVPGARRQAASPCSRPTARTSTRPCARYIEARGVEVPVLGSFDEEDDLRAARIDVASIRAAAIELGRDPRVDAVFVACTSLRVAEAAAEIEAALGKPVTSSNHAMAWHALRLAGIADPVKGWGSLLRLPL